MKASTGQKVVAAAAIAAVGYFAWDWWKKRQAGAPTPAAGARASAPLVAPVARTGTATAQQPSSFWSSTLAKVTSGSLAQASSWGARGTGSAEQPEDLFGSRSFGFSV